MCQQEGRMIIKGLVVCESNCNQERIVPLVCSSLEKNRVRQNNDRLVTTIQWKNWSFCCEQLDLCFFGSYIFSVLDTLQIWID